MTVWWRILHLFSTVVCLCHCWASFAGDFFLLFQGASQLSVQNKCDAHFAKFRITIFGAVMMLKKCYEVTKAQRAKKSGKKESHIMSYFLPSFFISRKKATVFFLFQMKKIKSWFYLLSTLYLLHYFYRFSLLWKSSALPKIW